MARLDDVRVRMVDGDVEAERLQQHVLVEHQILGLLGVALLERIGRLELQADVHHLDDVLELARLLLDLSGEKECCRGDAVPMELREGMERVEPVHVHDGGVDAELGYLQPLAHVLDEVGGPLPVHQLLVGVHAAPSTGRVGQLLRRKVPLGIVPGEAGILATAFRRRQRSGSERRRVAGAGAGSGPAGTCRTAG